MFKRTKKTVFWKPAQNSSTGYLVLDGRTDAVAGIVAKSENLDRTKTKREDLDVVLDFDKEDRLIGIEIVQYD